MVYDGSDIGDAKQVIDHLAVYGQNYARAWDLVGRWYRNRRALVEEIQALIDLPQISLKDPKILGMALDTMRSVVQENLLKAEYSATESVELILFILARS